MMDFINNCNELRVLITGAGAPGMPGILKCLKKVKERKLYLIGVDMDENAPSRYEFDDFFICPKASDDNFICKILEIAKENKIHIIVPCVTRELEKFQKNKELFAAENIKIALSDDFELVNDKGKLLQLMDKNNIRCPEFYLADNYDELKEAIDKIGYPKNGFCIKGVTGNGSRGVRIIDSNKSFQKSFFEEKPNGLYCSFSDIVDTFKDMTSFPKKIIIMQLLSGAEYSVDMVVREGKVLVAVVRVGLDVVSSNQTSSVVVDRQDIIDYCAEVVALTNLTGNIGFDIKCDDKNIPYIIECNPRYTGGIVTCLAAGANMPWLGIKCWLGYPVEQPQLKYGVKMQRFWNEKFFDSNDNELKV